MKSKAELEEARHAPSRSRRHARKLSLSISRGGGGLAVARSETQTGARDWLAWKRNSGVVELVMFGRRQEEE